MLLNRQLTKNIFSSWVNFGLRIVIAFFFIPFITKTLGEDRYGVWIIVFQTIAYFSLFDLGLERALLRFLSKSFGRANNKTANEAINTIWPYFIGIGTLIIILLPLSANYLFRFFNIENSDIISEGVKALQVLAFYVGIRFYLLPFSAALTGFQRHDLSMILQIVEEICRVTALVWLLSNGYGLFEMAIAIFLIMSLRQFASILIVRRYFPSLRFRPSFKKTDDRSAIIKYSRISFGISLAWLVIFNSDAILLGALSSAAAAGIFAPASQLMLYLRNIVNVVGAPLTAAISHWESNDDFERIIKLYLNGIRYLSFASVFLAVSVYFWADSFVALWLPEAFSEASRAMVILVIGTAVFLPQILGNAILFGTDRHSHLLKVLIFEVILRITLAIYLVPKYGVTGMAIATTIPQLLLYSTLYPMLIARTLTIQLRTIAVTCLNSAGKSLLISLPTAYLISQNLSPTSWTLFITGTAATTLIVATAAYFVLLNQSERVRFKTLIQNKE